MGHPPSLLFDRAVLGVQHELYLSFAIQAYGLIEVYVFEGECFLLAGLGNSLQLPSLQPILPRQERRSAFQDDQR